MGSSRLFTVLFVLALQVVGTFQQDTNLNNMLSQCAGSLDVVFAIDGSGSLGLTNFQIQISSVTTVITQLATGSNSIHAGAVLYSSTTETIGIQSDLNNLAQEINNWDYLGDGTDTAQAISDAREIFTNDSREGTVPKLLIIITDGRSNDRTRSENEANLARSEGITIVAVGVTNSVNEDELNAIAGGNENVFYAITFDVLFNVLVQAIERACTDLISAPQAPAGCYFGTTDVWLVVDVSASAEQLSRQNTQNDFSTLKDSLRQFINVIQNDSFQNPDIRMGFISYSDSVIVETTTRTANSVAATAAAIDRIPNGITSGGSNLLSALSTIRLPARQGNYHSYVVIITPVAMTAAEIGDLQSQKDRLESLGYKVVSMSIGERAGSINQRLASSSRYSFQSLSYDELHTSFYDFTRSALCGGPKAKKLPGLCSTSGRDVKNLAFASHPYHCDQYLQCYYREDGEFDVAVTRKCPSGFFWHNTNQKCEISCNVQCENDDCKHSCTPRAIPGNCRGYYKCEKGRSVGQCCPENHVFVSGSGCVEDKEHSCSDHCDWDQVTCLAVECRRRPNWAHPGSYELSGTTVYPFNTLFTTPCFGKEFDAVTCGCTVHKGHECTADRTFNFAEQTVAQLIRGNSLEGIHVQGVTISGTGITFTEGSKLHLDSTHKRDNEPLTLRFRFREAAGWLQHDHSQVLISSSTSCSESCHGSLMIRSTSAYIGFYIFEPDGTFEHLDIPFEGLDPNEFKEVTFVYDNGYMAATMKGEYQQYIETKPGPKGAYFPCGFDFGTTDDYDGFRGEIEYISLYSCTPARLY